MENQNQQVPEQPQAQQEEKKKGISPFLKGALFMAGTIAGTYVAYKYRHEIMRGGKKLGKKVTGLFSGKKKEDTLDVLVITERVPNDERPRREHRPQQQFPNHQPNNGQWNNRGNNNPNNVKR